jgi:hypothetical protein
MVTLVVVEREFQLSSARRSNCRRTHLALQLDKVGPTSVECVFVEGKNQWLWPLRAHLVFEFPPRGGMSPVTVHTYQNMRGDFQDPPGMAEGERLFPPMNNLVEKGRPFVQGGDGMMLVSTQLTVDGKPISQQGRGGAFPPGGGRGPGAGRGPGGPGGRGLPPGVSQDPKMRGPGNGAVFVGSKGYMATTSRGEGVWLLPASRWAEYKLPPQMLPRGVIITSRTGFARLRAAHQACRTSPSRPNTSSGWRWVQSHSAFPESSCGMQINGGSATAKKRTATSSLSCVKVGI